MHEVRFINIEYIFYKIYDFFANAFGGSGGYVTQRTFGQWLSDTFRWLVSDAFLIGSILFVVLFIVVIYIRLDIYDSDQKRKERYEGHFIKPEPKSPDAKNPRWERIVMLFASTNPNDWKVAIIDADNMLDELTQSMGIPGETLGERLRNASPNRLLVESAGEAHGIRNRIAHDAAYVLDDRDAQRAKRLFEATFLAAGIIS